MRKKVFNITLFILFLLGFLFLFFSHFYQESKVKQEEQKVEEYINVSSSGKENYIGVLEIPKIHLKRGFYDLSSKKNTVAKNIEMIETSLMPDVEASNLILASHSGNSKISYFKNLYKLKIKDIAIVYYNRNKYTYELVDKYDVLKDGSVEIKRNQTETNLTLITCDRKNKKLQNVYIFKLING